MQGAGRSPARPRPRAAPPAGRQAAQPGAKIRQGAERADPASDQRKGPAGGGDRARLGRLRRRPASRVSTPAATANSSNGPRRASMLREADHRASERRLPAGMPARCRRSRCNGVTPPRLGQAGRRGNASRHASRAGSEAGRGGRSGSARPPSAASRRRARHGAADTARRRGAHRPGCSGAGRRAGRSRWRRNRRRRVRRLPTRRRGRARPAAAPSRPSRSRAR